MTEILQPEIAQSEASQPEAPRPTVRTASARLAERSQQHLSPALGRYFQRGWSHGKGHQLYDLDGRGYLDFATGLATTVLGHGHPKVNAAIHAQVDRLVHVCNGLGYVEPVTDLAEAISAAMPPTLDTVFFGNSGTEAVEAAIKLARRVTRRPAIVAFTGGFHGRTYGSLSATTSNLNYRTGHGPFVPDVHIAPFPNVYRDFAGDAEKATRVSLERLRGMLATEIPPGSVAAFLIEPVQGEGGFYPVPLEYLRGLRHLADEIGALLICDEIQCGYGRTGMMWAFEHAAIVPDIVTLAKAIAGGLPLGAMVSNGELQERWGVGAHGSTFGGNPVACAAGVAVLEVIKEEGLVANSAARGAELRAGLESIARDDPRIGDVRGRGLMMAVEFVTDRSTREPDGALGDATIESCADAGLLLLTCAPAHNVVRWLPPLDVTSEEITQALGTFRQVLAASAAR